MTYAGKVAMELCFEMEVDDERCNDIAYRFVKRVLEDAAKEARNELQSIGCSEPDEYDSGQIDMAHTILSRLENLADREVPETGTPGSQT